MSPPRQSETPRILAVILVTILVTMLATLALSVIVGGHMPAPVSGLSEVPTSTPASVSQLPPAAPSTPRAELVKLVKPPPRPLLISLPPDWRVGHTRLLKLPSGLEAVAKLKGCLRNESDLPMTGNRLGDTWVIGDQTWLWLVAPSSGAPAWVDP